MSSTERRPRLDPGRLLHGWVVLTVVAGMAFPLAWMLYSSLKSNQEIFARPFGLPQDPDWGNWWVAWTTGDLGRLYLNSLLVTGSAVLIVVSLAALAAYAFARLRFPGRDALFYLFLIGLLLPPQTVIIPLFSLLRDLGLLNTYWALILPYASWPLALTIFMLRSFYRTLPGELEDAARIDGAGLWTTFWHVMLPLVRPALVTMVILNAVNLWNELLFALLFIQEETMRTLPAGLMAFYGYHSVDYKLVFAALSIATVPVLIFYFIFQRQIIAGLTVGSLD
ncbi:MAG: carbohydrate ABC transporter permease [Trueperaceae bacterium]|nr:carbohydrate ABC transporter permease [Trueperaceae bacterium]